VATVSSVKLFMSGRGNALTNYGFSVGRAEP
jgi:hypothetical protein